MNKGGIHDWIPSFCVSVRSKSELLKSLSGCLKINRHFVQIKRRLV